MTNVLVLAEQRGGSINPVSIETIVAGQQLAAALGVDLDVALLGGDLDTAAGELAHVAAGHLVLVSDAALEPYSAEAYCLAAQTLVEQLAPRYVLLPHTYLARDFAPRLAAGFGHALISDCTGYRLADGEIVFVRLLFQGKVHADIVVRGDGPHFISFQAGAFRADHLQTGTSEARPMDVALDAAQLRTRSEAPVREMHDAIDLTSVDVIVSVGRGIQSEENIGLARQLAEALDGEVAASRPVCDAGWISSDRQIGSSGQTVAPKLYLALGISGAMQHMVGVKGAKTIAAINTDPTAPIFESADFGIVGDVLEVAPALVEELASGP